MVYKRVKIKENGFYGFFTKKVSAELTIQRNYIGVINTSFQGCCK